MRDSKNPAARYSFEVELHSTDPSAVQAVFQTISQLGGLLYERDGRYFVDSYKPDFLKFAVVQQGYVKRVVPEEEERSGSQSDLD